MRPDDALRGPGGTFGVIDNPLQRLSLFDTDGALVRTTPLPPVFLAPAPLLANLAGAVFDIAGSNIHLVEVDETTGEIKWRRFFPSDLVQCGDGITPRSHLGFGLPTRSGGLAMVSCRGYSVTWFEDRDDDLPAAVIESPTAVKAEHGDREVEQYIADTRRMAGAAPSSADVAHYRERLRDWAPLYGHRLDSRDRLWVQTVRGGDDSSYLDVFRKTGYAGTFQVRHRVVGFDLLGPTLVALVDRPLTDRDPGGIPRRGIDWYDISEVDLGQGKRQ